MDKPVRGTSGLALAEPPSSAPTLRMPTWRDLFGGPDAPLPVVQPLLEFGAAVQLDVIGRIPVSNGPVTAMVASPDGRQLVVANYGDDSVSVLDTVSATVSKTLTGIYEPYAVAAAGDGRVYLSAVTPGYDAIALLDVDTEQLVAAYPQAGVVRDVVVSANGKKVYAACAGPDGAEVAVLEAATGDVEVIAVAADASADRMALSADGRRLYVAVERSTGSELAVIDTAKRRVVGSIEVGPSISDIALSSDGRTAYLTSCGAATVQIVDTRTKSITEGINVAGGAIAQLSLSADGERLYLLTDSAVTVLSTFTHDVVGVLPLAGQPSCLVESADGARLYVADYAGTVTAVAIAWNSLDGEVAGLLEREPALV